MDISKLIRDVHQTSIIMGNYNCSKCNKSMGIEACSMCEFSDRFNGYEENLELVYNKLICTIDAYKRGDFANIDNIDIDSRYDLEVFRAVFLARIKDTFEGKLTEFLFISSDLMGYIIDDKEYNVTVQESLMFDISSSIEEELTSFAVKLEHIKKKYLNSRDLLKELTSCASRIFNACKHENIGIKTHIRLNFLYNFTL